MPKGSSPPPELYALVRDALTHLYDQAHLENHPLATMVNAAADNLDRISRAQRVRRLLLDCIETLKPQGNAPSEAARAYAILSYRYVDGLAMPVVAQSLALSRRQAYREHEKGIKAVVRLVWDRMTSQIVDQKAAVAPAPAPGSQINLAQTEVDRLKQTARPEPLDLRAILYGVIETLLPICQSRGVHIDIHLPDTWPQLLGSRTLVRQAILNLLSYGVKMVKGALFLRIISEGEGYWLEMRGTVGGTIPQSPTGMTAESDIGFAVAQSLINAQGGRLYTCQEKDAWMCRVWLPTFGRNILLVIDDNQDIVALFRRYLGGHNVAVVSASNGEQALQLAVELRPQLITLDVMMPDVDGWEILQQLKSHPVAKDIPVIVCSVLNEPQLAQAMGASDYITKPVSQDEFVQVLRRWLPLFAQATLPSGEPPAENSGFR